MKEDAFFIKNIRKLIKESGYKQEAIAIKAGYDPKKFSNMLNGRKIITAKDIVPIATALNVNPDDLFKMSANESA